MRYLCGLVRAVVACKLRVVEIGAWGRVSQCLLLLACIAAGSSAAFAQLPSPSDEPITPIPAPAAESTPQAALGAMLFADPRLSGSGTISCATCHDLHSNGASAARRMPLELANGKPVNTLTVFNAALSFRFNWQGNARSLAEQAAGSLTNQAVMATNPEKAVRAIAAEPGVAARFQAAFGHAPDWPSILQALAAFESSLLTPDSRFDLWLKGDRGALTTAELDGYRLFKSVGCVSCHQGAGIGGNLFEKVGVVKNTLPDTGKLLRVPSLRNVAVLPPYFHDGSTPTLKLAVSRMASGQLGLALSDSDLNAIIAFLNTLTGRYQGQPVTAAQ